MIYVIVTISDLSLTTSIRLKGPFICLLYIHCMVIRLSRMLNYILYVMYDCYHHHHLPIFVY
ncbi:hypothetical protein Hanom_Chr09g00811951 [Helianthus anomalus]